jgi:hypothetical protein
MDHVQWVPYHHSMVCPQVTDGDGLHLWRVGANILNKQLRTAPYGWSSSLGKELTTPYHKKYYKGPQKRLWTL